MHIGKVIKLIRTTREMKQKDLAQQVGISQNYLSLIETGRKEPRLSVVRKIAEQFDVPLSYVFLLASGDLGDVNEEERKLLAELKSLMQRIEQLRMEM